MRIDTATIDTPIGQFTILVDEDGSVLASGWTTDPQALLALVHPSLRAAPQVRPDLGPVTKAALSYFEGDLTAPDGVPVRQVTGGSFLGQGWTALRQIAPGQPVSYQQLAALAGRPAATRAAAQACARNAAALFVPCHRAVRSDGGLGGFRWGLPIKQWLLDHEQG